MLRRPCWITLPLNIGQGPVLVADSRVRLQNRVPNWFTDIRHGPASAIQTGLYTRDAIGTEMRYIEITPILNGCGVLTGYSLLDFRFGKAHYGGVAHLSHQKPIECARLMDSVRGCLRRQHSESIRVKHTNQGNPDTDRSSREKNGGA